MATFRGKTIFGEIKNGFFPVIDNETGAKTELEPGSLNIECTTDENDIVTVFISKKRNGEVLADGLLETIGKTDHGTPAQFTDESDFLVYCNSNLQQYGSSTAMAIRTRG